MCSLVDKRDGVEHMWEADPKFWPRHAPILFPCVGESKNGEINVDGKSYTMGRHGFARHELFSVVAQGASHATFELRSDPNSLRQYPFDFVLRIKYNLEGSKLTQSFEVVNSGINKMAFQLGGHPAFAVPFDRKESYCDYQITFNQPQTLDRHLLTKDGLYSGETKLFLENDSSFGLTYELFSEDALVFKNIGSRKVWIENKTGGKRLEMEYKDFNHFGIWSVPGADYVCLEPWIGCADMADAEVDYFGKDSAVSLQPSEVFLAEFSIAFHQ